MKVTQNVKKWPPNCQKKMLIFGLHTTFDDWLSNPSDESHPKCKEMAAKLSKNEILIFGLCSNSDDWPSNLSNESCTKFEKNGKNFYGKIDLTKN